MIINREYFKELPRCRICGIEINSENGVLGCRNICCDCRAWKQDEYKHSVKGQYKGEIDNKKRAELHRKYYEFHKDEIVYKENLALQHATRRAQRCGAEGSFTSEEWRNKLVEFDYRCAYCGEKSEKLTKDHILPISKGGSNNISNIMPACLSCNCKKHNKTVEEFMRTEPDYA